MEVLENVAKSFAFGDYIVECVYLPEDDTVEFWLQHKNYGIKLLMFGENANDIGWHGKGIPDTSVIDLIENNLDSYIKEYQEQYEDQ